MFYSNQVTEIRQFYIQSWKKYQHQQALAPLEKQICDVITMHPEYQKWLNESFLDTSFHPEVHGSNPFMHMGLHLAIIEQIQTDRPQGIREVYQQLLSQYVDRHSLEHALMDTLSQVLWEAQKTQQAPDEKKYLQQCKQLIKLQR